MNSGSKNNAILQLTNNAYYNHEQSFPPTGALQEARAASIQKTLYVWEQHYCDAATISTLTTTGNTQVGALKVSGNIHADEDVKSATKNMFDECTSRKSYVRP